jgi:hypothetical protein
VEEKCLERQRIVAPGDCVWQCGGRLVSRFRRLVELSSRLIHSKYEKL